MTDVAADQSVPVDETSMDWRIYEQFLAGLTFDDQRQNELFLPPPQRDPNGTYVQVDSRCGHCQELAARIGYRPTAEDGGMLTYVDLSTDAGHAFYEQYLADAGAQGTPSLIQMRNGTPTVVTSGTDEIIAARFPQQAAADQIRLEAIVAQLQAELGQTQTAPADLPATAPPSQRAAEMPVVVASSAPVAPATPAPAAISQDQLLTIGQAMVAKVAAGDAAVIAAVEQFYAADGTTPMQGLGTLSDTEMTAVLNRMQLSMFDPAVRDRVLALGSTLGVEGLNAPASMASGAFPDGASQAPNTRERDASASL